MEERDRPNSEARPGESGKRKYEPPEILSQEVFETTALACSKVVAGPCNAMNIKS